MRSKICTFLAAVAVFCFGSSLLAADPPAVDDWPCLNGPNHDGHSLSKGLLKEWPMADPKKPGPKDGPPLLWKVAGGKGFSSVAVVGGKVFITGDAKSKDAKEGKEYLSALSADGKELWRVECGQECKEGSEGCKSGPTVDSGNVYTLDVSGLLNCFDAETGKKKWSREAKEFGGKPPQGGHGESPLVFDNMVIFKPGGENGIVALDKATGKDFWKSPGFKGGPGQTSCTPFVHNNVPYIVTGTGEGLVCVKAKTGEPAWKHAFAAEKATNAPLYSDGYVFWGTTWGKNGICLKLDPDGMAAKEGWKGPSDTERRGYIIDNSFVYTNDEGGWLCSDLKTGKKAWLKERKHEGGQGWGSICAADGMFYINSDPYARVALAAFTPEGIKITGRIDFQGTGLKAAPVVAGGRLYVRFRDNLYCYEIKAK